MSFRIARVKHFFTFILTVMLALACAGCGSKPAAITGTPQAGEWEAEFSFKSDRAEDYHWTITFTVNQDGKTIASTKIFYYQGELTSDTQASFIDSHNEISIEENSFEFSFTEWRGFTSNTYEGKATFTSVTEAKGTINIDGIEYEWTASPVSQGDMAGNQQTNASPSQEVATAAPAETAQRDSTEFSLQHATASPNWQPSRDSTPGMTTPWWRTGKACCT